MTAALGLASRPTRSRSSMTRRCVIASQTPRASPGREPAIDGLPRREAGWQHAPCDAAAQDVEDGVDDLAHRPLRRSANAGWRRQKRLQNGPLGVRQVTGEAKPVAHMLRAGGCGPHGRVHPTRSRQPVGITSYRDHPTPIPLPFRDSLLEELREFPHETRRIARHAGRVCPPQYGQSAYHGRSRCIFRSAPSDSRGSGE